MLIKWLKKDEEWEAVLGEMIDQTGAILRILAFICWESDFLKGFNMGQHHVYNSTLKHHSDKTSIHY